MSKTKTIIIVVVVILVLLLAALLVSRLARGESTVVRSSNVNVVEGQESYSELEETTNIIDIRYIEKYFVRWFYSKSIGQDDIVNNICPNYSSNLPNEITEFRINKMYYIYSIYAVDMSINNSQYYYVLVQDSENNTFEIKEYTKEEFDELLKGRNLLDKYTNYSVAKKSGNELNVSDLMETYYYYELFNKKVIEDVDASYELLDVDYRVARFGTIEGYRSYINMYRVFFDNIGVFSSDVVRTDDYVEYHIANEYARNYIIRVDNDHKMYVKLDTYTLKSDDEKLKYSNLDKKSKAEENLKQVVEMINTRDYDKLFELLDPTFKSTYFQDINAFRSFIDSNFYIHCGYTYKNLNDINNTIYSYNVKMNELDLINSSFRSMDVGISIGLGENDSFTYSFMVTTGQ